MGLSSAIADYSEHPDAQKFIDKIENDHDRAQILTFF
jgi:hypothetical protein